MPDAGVYAAEPGFGAASFVRSFANAAGGPQGLSAGRSRGSGAVALPNGAAGDAAGSTSRGSAVGSGGVYETGATTGAAVRSDGTALFAGPPAWDAANRLSKESSS